jgi:hypothetical protein
VSVHKVGYFVDRPCILSPKGCENSNFNDLHIADRYFWYIDEGDYDVSQYRFLTESADASDGELENLRCINFSGKSTF